MSLDVHAVCAENDRVEHFTGLGGWYYNPATTTTTILRSENTMVDGRRWDVSVMTNICNVLTVVGRLINFVCRKPTSLPLPIDKSKVISAYRFAVYRAIVVVSMLCFFQIPKTLKTKKKTTGIRRRNTFEFVKHERYLLAGT